MKIFSRALLAFILAATAAPLAKATVTTVSGNVYDVGKYTFSDHPDWWWNDGAVYIGPSESGAVTVNDSATCWAAGSANILQYWQDTYYNSSVHKNTLTNVEAPTGLSELRYDSPQGTGSLEIYNYILQNWQNGAGDPVDVYTWWMQGRTGNVGGTYTSIGSQPNSWSSGGAFFKDIFGVPAVKSPSLDRTCFYSAQIDTAQSMGEGVVVESIRPTYELIKNTIKKAFETDGQAVTLKVIPASNTGHVISCWGYEEDEATGTFSLILSDSDDAKFGTFMVTMTKTEAGTASIQTDRRHSWYYTGGYEIADAAYILTPTGIAEPKTEAREISDLSPTSTATSGTVKRALSTTSPVVFGDPNSPIAALITSSGDGAISVSNSNSAQASVKIEDGAMLLLLGDFSVTGPGQDAQPGGGGIFSDGQLYIHGGNTTVTNNSASHSGGGIYACGIINKTDEDFKSQAESTSAPGYLEIKGAGNVAVSNNRVVTDNTYYDGGLFVYNAGGGGVASEGSFVVSSNQDVNISNNSAAATNVYGGGAFATFDADLNANKSLTINQNTLAGDGMQAYGGGVTAMCIEMNGNGALSISGNTIQLSNLDTKRNWDSWRGSYQGGASVGGGAVAAKVFVELTQRMGSETTLTYIPASLSMDGNGSISINDNKISATYTGSAQSSITSEPCLAQGGAIYLEGYKPISKTAETVGSVASISHTSGDVTFSRNRAVSSSSVLQDDKAQGGAIYVGESSSLTMVGNGGTVTFSENSVDGNAAQGGAIYNEGTLIISGNHDVRFADNTAKEGDHIYNADEATVDISGNEHVSFQSSGNEASVVNKGKMYLASSDEGSIRFTNSTLKTEDNGITYLGSDSKGGTGKSLVTFTNGSKEMGIQASNSVAELSRLTVSADMIAGMGIAATLLQQVKLESTAELGISALTMKADVGISALRTSMESVVIDLSGIAYQTMTTGQGTGYIYDLDSVVAGGLTLKNVTFVSSDSNLSTYLNGADWIAFNFGGDVDFGEVENVQMSIAGANAQYLTSKNGAVYFGENVNPPDINVPEPATGMLALVGLAGLAGRRRRK